MKELVAYMREVMRVKNLRGIDIEAQSGGRITDSYLSDIINGKTKNISVEKVNALAKGMGVDSWDVFQAASGNKVIHAPDDPWSGYTLIRAMETVMGNPDLTAILQALILSKPSKIKALRKQIEQEKN